MRTLPGTPSWSPYTMAVLSIVSAYHASSSGYPLKHYKDQSCYCISIKSMKKHISIGLFYTRKSDKLVLWETTRIIIKTLWELINVLNKSNIREFLKHIFLSGKCMNSNSPALHC